MTLGRYPQDVPQAYRIPAEVFEAEYEIPRFEDIAQSLGLDDFSCSGGAIADDFDGDGLLDIVTTGMDFRDQMRIYRNRGDGTFEDRTEAAALEGELGGLNLIHGDYDNDGDLDLFVLRGGWVGKLMGPGLGSHPNSLLRNDGAGNFENVTIESGLWSSHPTATAVWADLDGDGWLDLFIGNESYELDPNRPELFLNQQDGSFVEVSARAGVGDLGYVKGVTCADYDHDGRVDILVSILGKPNVLLRNRTERPGEVRFEEVPGQVTEPMYSFVTWFWDYDNDGWEDLYIGGYTPFDSTSLHDLPADYLRMPLRTCNYPRV